MAERRSGFWQILYRAKCLAGLELVALAAPAVAIVPGDPGPGDVAFSVDSGQNVRAISPFIYGMNFFAGSTLTNPVTVDRLGGNRWSGYNWETNASNAGSDYFHYSDNYLVNFQSNTPPGEAVRPSLVAAAENNRALIVTVPTAGYVSADSNGAVTEAQSAPSSRWNQVVAKKSAIYPESSLLLAPDESDDYVFTDEFVHWVESTKSMGQEVFYDLDNEPGLWDSTHARLHPVSPTFSELRATTIAHASAIKDVNPSAIVFGGVGYGWNEFTSLQDAVDQINLPAHPGGDQAGEMHYYEYLLQQMRAAEISQGRTLVDVLDLHWYPEARSGTVWNGGTRITFEGGEDISTPVVEARVQAPRSLWDPTYTETGWITQWSTVGPIMLLPRVQRDIDDFKPGTKIAITEYNFGGTHDISGAIAQADVLGIFAQEEVFAATFWSLQGDGGSQFASGAFQMYLDYDGAGGTFGDWLVEAGTDDIAASSVYASVDSADPNRMVVVAINRTGQAQDAAITIEHDRIFDHAEVYQLTSAASNPTRVADLELDLVNAFIYSMPEYSVTTLVLISDGLPGDYNRDGRVDAADFTVWRDSLGQTGNLPADGNENNTVDGADYALWKDNFGRWELAGGSGSLAAAVPEPAAIAIFCCLGWFLMTTRNRSHVDKFCWRARM
jgi:hypothetical protein